MGVDNVISSEDKKYVEFRHTMCPVGRDHYHSQAIGQIKEKIDIEKKDKYILGAGR
jgi:hypothetical protein